MSIFFIFSLLEKKNKSWSCSNNVGNIASGLISPASEAMLIDVSTEKTRAFMYAINYWANNLALMVGMLIGGWLFE